MNSIGLAQIFLQHPQPPRHSESRYFGRRDAQTAFAAAGRQVHMQPWHIIHETLEEAGGEDVVGFAVQRALLDVGHF